MNLKKVENLLLGLPAWVLSAVTVSAVMYLTLVPRPLPDMGVSFWEHTDKVVHAIMMAGVVWAVSLDIMRRNRSRVIRLRFPDIVAVCVAVVLFGGAIELAQALNLSAAGPTGPIFGPTPPVRLLPVWSLGGCHGLIDSADQL